MKIALGVSYCGSSYHGWQRQKHTDNTIQYRVEQAISTVANEKVTSVCAGRTDSGVHATGQVIHVETVAIRSMHGWQMGINKYLPSDIRINWVKMMPSDFHARFSAKYRRYNYIIEDNIHGNAIFNNLIATYRYGLNEQAMHKAAQVLLGEQDFSAFRASRCQSNTSYRHIDFINIYRNKQFVIIDIQANAFLYHMVRNIVGVLLLIGIGRKNTSWLLNLLKQKDRKLAPATAVASGLYLVEIGYNSLYNVPLNNRVSLPFV